MSLTLSKSDVIIMRAIQLGYKASINGEVYSPEGVEIKGSAKKGGGHYSITLIVPMGGRRRYPVLKHRFVYYYFNGYEMFKHQVVRHLNDIPSDNRLTNLKAGSHKENMNDIPRHIRSDAMTPDRIKTFVDLSRKLSDTQITEIRRRRDKYNIPYYKLANEYGVSTMTIYRLCNGQAWKNIKESKS